MGLNEAGPGAVESGLIGRGINLIQHLPGLNIRALLKFPTQDDAIHARVDLGDFDRVHTSGQLVGHCEGLRDNGDDADLRRRRRAHLRLAPSTSGQ